LVPSPLDFQPVCIHLLEHNVQQNVLKCFYLYDHVITLGHTKPDHNEQVKPISDLIKLYKRKDIIAMSVIILSSFYSILIFFFLTNYPMQMLTGSDPRIKSLVEVMNIYELEKRRLLGCSTMFCSTIQN
jgi:hypothetical protein